MTQLLLNEGREKAILRRHPWIFSGAIRSLDGSPKLGETVSLCDAHGKFLAWGAYSPNSQIRARIWSWDEAQNIGPDFFRKRIDQALKLRERWIEPKKTTAYRLIHAESDNLPGLVVDRYNRTLVVQILSAGIEYWRDEIVRILAEQPDVDCIYERSDVSVRELEGLPQRTGVLMGELPQQPITIQENDLKFLVDITTGQKTGFYLDQRDNRQFCRQVSGGRSILNCFSYTGGFTVYALAGGAQSVLSIDSSEDAIRTAQENILLNQGDPKKCDWIVGDVFSELRTLRDRGQSFDMVILDPPKFAPTAAQARQAARGYKDINLLGLKLLKPGGLLMTFSCSGGIDANFFQKIVADAALDAGADAQILYRLGQAPDHPTHLAFPEGTYLKGLVCRKLAW